MKLYSRGGALVIFLMRQESTTQCGRLAKKVAFLNTFDHDRIR
jgi:hypothetical protein